MVLSLSVGEGSLYHVMKLLEPGIQDIDFPLRPARFLLIVSGAATKA
jgi:hypothetical protein